MNLLPRAMKVAAQTIGLNLVSVEHMSGFTKEMEDERNREIRRRKIETLMTNKTWSDYGDLPHEENIYKGIDLTYIGFKYGSNTTPVQVKHKKQL